MLIRRLTPADAASFMEIRREALERERLAFGSSPGEDVAQSFEQVQGLLGQGEGAVFGAFDSAIAGVVGVRTQTRQKERHKAALYAKLGFVIWGTEPAALHVNGADLSERHMVLKL